MPSLFDAEVCRSVNDRISRVIRMEQSLLYVALVVRDYDEAIRFFSTSSTSTGSAIP